MTESLTSEEMVLLRDALTQYADSRLKIARRRDRREGGFAVERALGGFFKECRRLDSKLLMLIRDKKEIPSP
jgi:hypothetical protein